jgi:hypothetical protein
MEILYFHTKINEQKAQIRRLFMKNKGYCLGILVMVLVFGMTVVGCEEESDPDPEGYFIELKEIKEKTGTVSILLYTHLDASATGVHAGGQGTISNGSVKVRPTITGGSYWSGSGTYNVLVGFSDGSVYAYTEGRSLDQLGITTEADFYSKIPKYTFTKLDSPYPYQEYFLYFDKFIDVTDF